MPKGTTWPFTWSAPEDLESLVELAKLPRLKKAMIRWRGGSALSALIEDVILFSC